MKKKIILVLDILSILVLSLLLAGTVFAWFYFPSSKNLIIETAPDLDVEVSVYHMEVNEGNDSYEFVLVDLDKNDIFTVNTSLVFFHWGGEYICESNKDDYYAIVLTYNSSSFSNHGNLKALLGANVECSSSFYYEDENEEEINLRFPIVELSYSVASTNQLNLLSSSAVVEARNASYTNITLNGEDDQNDPSFIVTGVGEKLFSSLDSRQYVETFLNEESQTDTRLKIVFFVKLTAAEGYVNTIMQDLEESFGSALSISIANQITIQADLRSVPMHTPKS